MHIRYRIFVNSFLVFFIINSLSIILFSCNKDDEKLKNHPPLLFSITPTQNVEIVKGDTLLVEFEAQDIDGKIMQTQIYIDSILIHATDRPSISLNWISKDKKHGEHKIELVAIDNSNNKTQKEFSVSVIEKLPILKVIGFSSSVTEDKSISVSIGSSVTANYEYPILEYGIFWRKTSESENEVKEMKIKFDDISSIHTTIDNLEITSSYNFWFYAKNQSGLGYSDTVTVKTPTYATISSKSISGTDKYFSFAIINLDHNGGTNIKELGTVIDTQPNPTTDESIVIPASQHQGEVVIRLNNLESSTRYYVRSYVINEVGLTYGNELSFITNVEKGYEVGELIDDRDGQVYKTVRQHNGWWMAENLNHKGGYYYKYDSSNYRGYGRLYDYFESQRICPLGWHIPTLEEWRLLASYFGSPVEKIGGNAGKKLFSGGPSEFNAQYGGYYDGYEFKEIKELGSYYTSTINDTNDHRIETIEFYGMEHLMHESFISHHQFSDKHISCRCKKDGE